jgi:hypothetical protein
MAISKPSHWGENQTNWSFLMQDVHHVFPRLSVVDSGFCLMHDANKGFDASHMEVFPHFPLKHCLRHIVGNMSSLRQTSASKQKIWAAARALAASEFDEHVSTVDANAKACLLERGYSRWALSARSVATYGIITNNHAESMSHVFKELRFQHFARIIEDFSVLIMRMFSERKAVYTPAARNLSAPV